MTTKSITVGQDWVKISDGTQQANGQVPVGMIELRDEAQKPSAKSMGHPVSGWIKITPPTIAWARAVGSSKVNFIITYY